MENVLLHGDSKFRSGADGLKRIDDKYCPSLVFVPSKSQTIASAIYVSYMLSSFGNDCGDRAIRQITTSDDKGSKNLNQL